MAAPHKDRTAQIFCSIASPARHSFCAHWQKARRWQLWQTSVPPKSRTAGAATEPGVVGFRKMSGVSKGAGIRPSAGSSTCASASEVVFEIMMLSVTRDATRNKLHRREVKASYVPNKSCGASQSQELLRSNSRLNQSAALPNDTLAYGLARGGGAGAGCAGTETFLCAARLSSIPKAPPGRQPQ